MTTLSSLDSTLVANWGFQDVFLVPSFLVVVNQGFFSLDALYLLRFV